MPYTRRQTLDLGLTAVAGLGLSVLLPRWSLAQDAAAAPHTYPADGGEIAIHPVSHASLVMRVPGTVIYADPVGAAHVRLRLRAGDGRQIGAVAFRALNRPLGNALLSARGQTLHVAGTLSRDSWQGVERVELRVLDAAQADPLAAH